MPVFVWSNGACVADGTSARNFLTQIASYGYLVISQGTPGGKGTSNAQMMQEAVTWAANGANGLFNVNRAKIAVGGYSCGGAETWSFINDNRVSSLGIYNSGGTGLANTIRKPYFIVLGGPSDIAYNNVSFII
jgi:endo-1,4-beta-xylanase